MNCITYIELDVHTLNYTICAYTIENDTPSLKQQSIRIPGKET